MKRRIVAMAMTVSMLAASLAGCSGGQEAAATTAAVETTTAATVETTAATEAQKRVLVESTRSI